MNITTIASTLDWRPNNKGTWKALVKDMAPDSAVTFANGYTATVSGRSVTVQNDTSPVGVMTYETDLADAVSAGTLYGAGSVSDSLEAVAGDKTVRMGSVDLGTLDWLAFGNNRFTAILSDGVNNNCACSLYVKSNSDASIMQDKTIRMQLGVQQGNAWSVVVRDSSYSVASDFKTAMSGVMAYYELATPTTSTETPQSISLTTGDDTLSGGSFDTAYEGTDYSIPLIRNCKYLHRSPDGTESLVTGSTTNTSIDVKGGESKLINLTHWFGRNREPSIADFYKLYPTWKTYDIPYDQGSVLNYKGTGVETIGFNAYDHATGTAALLGGNKYQICGTFTSVSYVDIFGQTETITLDSANCFTPVNDGTLTVTGGNGTDTCVHLVWSGYKNYGEPEYKWEPFTRNVKEFPISTYFPEGMNSVLSADGTGVVYDELTSEQAIKRVGVVDAGTLTYNDYTNTQNTTYPYGYVSFTLPEKANGFYNLVSDLFATAPAAGSSSGFFIADKSIIGTSTNNVCYIINSDFIGMTGEQIKAALSGVLCYYELDTPVVTQIDQPLNIAYPVNDFGTEHSMPQNTTTLVTTDLKALIKYNTDYMRMNSQLSGIFPMVKSLVQQEQDGHIMKKDDTAPNATVGNAFNLIDRNAEGTERQFSYDTSGGTQDITDGTAVAKKSMGTTLNLNQLVHDTNQNTVTGNGQVEVEDAVAGDVTSLVVEGRSLVRNQLVPPSLEETEDSANGVVEVSDAVAGDALALRMTAPRSVVVNQLCNSRSSEWIAVDDSLCSFDYMNGEYTLNITSDYQNVKRVQESLFYQKYVSGHTYMLYVEVLNTSNFDARFGIKPKSSSSNVTFLATTSVSGQTWTSSYIKGVVSASVDCSLAFFTNIASTAGTSIKFRNMMCVDLTQYFNGDSALIDSIQTWDDLVTYDPRFANYVAYNTGTVTGVQPTVKVTGKNLANISGSGPYTSQSQLGVNDIALKKGTTIAFSAKITETSNIASAYLVITLEYIDGTISNSIPTTLVKGATAICYNTHTVSKDVSKITFYIAGSSSGYSASITDIQLELGSEVTAYEPYHDGGTAQATAPLFAVGNAADEFEAVTGVTTRKMASVDMGTLTWSYDSTYELYTCSTLAGTIKSQFKAVCTKYVYVGSYTNITDKTIGFIYNNYIALKDSAYSDAATLKTSLSGVYLYYELATPTEELLTSYTISLQTGNNVALQTDGGRTIPFNLTYDGTEFTLPLDNTHKYAYSDNGTKSIVTNATEQAVTGGQDMLVDVTRMFNGDATAINAVTSWADMAAVMPEYLSNVAYNEGEVVGRSGKVTTAVWNQLVQNGNFTTSTGWTSTSSTFSIASNVCTVAYQDGTVNAVRSLVYDTVSVTKDHVYLVYMECKVTGVPEDECTTIIARPEWFKRGNYGPKAVVDGAWHAYGILTKAGADYTTARLAFVHVLNTVNLSGASAQVRNVMMIDLSMLYGLGHAPNNIYGYTEEGAAAAIEHCRLIGHDLSTYQPYDTGTLMGGSATFSDLHGVGDVKETLDVITGEKQVKYGEVDLGTLSWNLTVARFYVNLPDLSSASISSICSKYVKTGATAADMADGTYRLGLGYATAGVVALIIRDDSYTTAAAFKTAVSGVMLYYELATPTTASLTPQPLTFNAGLNNVYEENMDITGTPVTMEYTGTDYTIAAKTSRVYLKDVNGTVERVTGVSSFSVRGGRDNVMDLTRMFGAGLEPGTLADFYSLFPTWRGYRLPYNKGSLLNFKGTGLKSVGFNLLNIEGRTLGQPQNTGYYPSTVRGVFDETKYYVGLSATNYYNPNIVANYSMSASSITVKATNSGFGVAFPIRVIPGQTYRSEDDRVSMYRVGFYTYNGTFISWTDGRSYTAPANAYWGLVVFASTANTEVTWTDPCVHLQWSGTRNGDYEPYWGYVRPIPTLTYFPDGMNGRGSVYDEINPRQAVKRFGKVDLGTLDWVLDSAVSSNSVQAWKTTSIANAISAPSANNVIPNIICQTLPVVTRGTALSDTEDTISVTTSGNLCITIHGEGYVNSNAFIADLSNVWLVYELATPVVTTFPEEISATARISDYGTEECLPVNGYDPVTTPFRGMVLYQDDYARTITKLPENYISKESMEAFLQLAGQVANGVYGMAYNPSTGQYAFTFTPNA